jgi:hypothetical protein
MLSFSVRIYASSVKVNHLARFIAGKKQYHVLKFRDNGLLPGLFQNAQAYGTLLELFVPALAKVGPHIPGFGQVRIQASVLEILLSRGSPFKTASALLYQLAHNGKAGQFDFIILYHRLVIDFLTGIYQDLSFHDGLMLCKIFVTLDELDHITRSPTAEAMKSVCVLVDLQAGILVLMKRAFQVVVSVWSKVVMG